MKLLSRYIHVSGEFFRGAKARGLIALLLFQCLAVALLTFLSSGVWPRDDSVTYIEQGLRIYLGGFPPDPARPVFYPLLLAWGMELFGFKPLLLRLFQGLFLVATTALTYRLTLRVLNRRAALMAAGLLVVFPDLLFFFFRFYREAMTAFLFILTLNLVDLMLDKPGSTARAVFAGTAAGMLCLIKPEFSSMLALLAFLGAAVAIKKRDFKTHLAPWLVCGAMALITVFPSILAARAHFGEWIFINTYGGYQYSCSYCGELGPDEGLPPIKEFYKYDRERYHSVNPLANNVLFFSKEEIPYGERDRFLLGKAWKCIKEDRKKAAWMLLNRFLATLFRVNQSAAHMIRNGDFGKALPPVIIESLVLLDWLVILAVLLMLGPGLFALLRDPRARPIALSIVWFAAFYSTVYYSARFRVAVFPAFAVSAAAGACLLPAAMKGKKAKTALIIWAILILILFFIVSPPSRVSAFRASSWRNDDIGQGLSRAHKRGFLIIAAEHYQREGARRRMVRELGRFIRIRRDSLREQDLIKVGDQFLKQAMPDVASFFYSMGSQIFGSDQAQEARKRTRSMRRSALITSFSQATESAVMGVMIYRATLSAPALISLKAAPLTMSVRTKEDLFSYNPGMSEGKDLEPFQYYCRGRTLWITLPLKVEPPSPGNPLQVHYYSASAVP